jgi:hypothetical protein
MKWLLFLQVLGRVDQDWFSEPQYQFAIEPLGLSHSNFVTKQFSCFIPTKVKPQMQTTHPKMIKQIPCLYFIPEKRYWAYEICRDHVVQFHPSNDNEKKYFLGIKSKEIDSKYQNERVVLIWGGGTKCEIIDQNRRVEVEYVCSQEERVINVREKTSCFYSVLVHTPRVCNEIQVPVIKCKLF